MFRNWPPHLTWGLVTSQHQWSGLLSVRETHLTNKGSDTAQFAFLHLLILGESQSSLAALKFWNSISLVKIPCVGFVTLTPPTSDERIQMACTSELLKLYRERVHRPRSSCTQTKASDHLSLYSLADSEKTSQGLALNLSRKGHYYYHHFYFMLNIGHFMDIHRHWALDEIVNQGHFETFLWHWLPASSHAHILISVWTIQIPQ